MRKSYSRERDGRGGGWLTLVWFGGGFDIEVAGARLWVWGFERDLVVKVRGEVEKEEEGGEMSQDEE